MEMQKPLSQAQKRVLLLLTERVWRSAYTMDTTIRAMLVLQKRGLVVRMREESDFWRLSDKGKSETSKLKKLT